MNRYFIFKVLVIPDSFCDRPYHYKGRIETTGEWPSESSVMDKAKKELKDRNYKKLEFKKIKETSKKDW